MPDESLSESTNVWLRFKAVFGGQTTSYRRRRELAAASAETPSEDQQPFGPHRDPVTSGDLLASLFRRNDWAEQVANAEVLQRWPEIVGDAVAEHTRALHVDAHVVVVQCDSTAWATQLRSLRSSLITKINAAIPGAAIEDLKFLNPGAPSWRHGKWNVAGRGPRDTYG